MLRRRRRSAPHTARRETNGNALAAEHLFPPGPPTQNPPLDPPSPHPSHQPQGSRASFAALSGPSSRCGGVGWAVGSASVGSSLIGAGRERFSPSHACRCAPSPPVPVPTQCGRGTGGDGSPQRQRGGAAWRGARDALPAPPPLFFSPLAPSSPSPSPRPTGTQQRSIHATHASRPGHVGIQAPPPSADSARQLPAKRHSKKSRGLPDAGMRAPPSPPRRPVGPPPPPHRRPRGCGPVLDPVAPRPGRARASRVLAARARDRFRRFHRAPPRRAGRARLPPRQRWRPPPCAIL